MSTACQDGTVDQSQFVLPSVKLLGESGLFRQLIQSASFNFKDT
jgi:hypothetical protein